MKCAICNAEDESVTHINTDCSVCQAIIYETIAGYDDDIDSNFDDDFEELAVEFVEGIDIESIPDLANAEY